MVRSSTARFRSRSSRRISARARSLATRLTCHHPTAARIAPPPARTQPAGTRAAIARMAPVSRNAAPPAPATRHSRWAAGMSSGCSSWCRSWPVCISNAAARSESFRAAAVASSSGSPAAVELSSSWSTCAILVRVSSIFLTFSSSMPSSRCRPARRSSRVTISRFWSSNARLIVSVSVAVVSVSRMAVNSTRMRSAAAALLDRRRCSSLRDATLSSVARSTPGSFVSAFVPFSMARTCWSRRRMAVVTSSPPPPTIRPSSLAMLLI